MAEQDVSLQPVIQAAFRGALDHLRTETVVMPLSRWNESVLRYCFCRHIATANPEVDQFVECHKIDLVIAQSARRAFIEFKFYRHPMRYDPYDGSVRGYKGGPGPKNLGEFRRCVDQLHERPYTEGLSKYVVIVYADPSDGSRPNLRYSNQYDAYQHPRRDIALRLLGVVGPFDTSEGTVQGRLYGVTAA